MKNDKPIHPNELSFEEGVFLVKLARRAIEEKLLNNNVLKPPSNTPPKLFRPGMVFTTVEEVAGENKYSLRGCIGLLAPIYSLVDAVIKTAIDAALNDPRFEPISPRELENVVVEVTILSIPEEIVADDRWSLPSQIVIGRDGLVAEKGFFKGTLLPTVPIEYCWDEETFLSETCIKAGLPPDCWLSSDVKIYRYIGRAFKEKEPRGEVYERNLSEEYRRLCFKS